MEFVDDCLINKQLYEKMNIKKKRQLEEKKLLALYESRILTLTTELLSSTEDEFICHDVRDSFRQYAACCISYFKFIDKAKEEEEETNDEEEKEEYGYPGTFEINEDDIRFVGTNLDWFVKKKEHTNTLG